MIGAMMPGQLAALLSSGALAMLGLHSTVFAPRDLRLSEVDVPIPDLPDAFDGYTIVVLADLHHGPVTSTEIVRRAVTMANDVDADLIALLGDYGTSFEYAPRLNARLYAKSLGVLRPELAKLRARDGVLGILGNHDHWYDAERVLEWLRELGATTLVNEHILIQRDGATLVIGGVDDPDVGRVDAAGGCGGASAEAPTIVLSHNPDGALHLTGGRRIDLILAGHTHGGQVVLPGFGAPITMSRLCTRRTASGWVPNPCAPLYVSRGVGAQIPVRFNCRPEIPIVRLRRGAARD